MRLYPTDLTDGQYDAMLRIIRDKRKRKHSLRGVLNAIFYLLKSGCQWRMLPSDFPKRGRVFYYFRKWSLNGTLEEILDTLRKMVRRKRGKDESPSACVIDSHSIRTTKVGGEERGFDGGKQVKGRKRHIVTDTDVLLVAVHVHRANVYDGNGGFEVLRRAKHKSERMKKVYADGGYRGALVGKAAAELGLELEITLRNDKATAFKPLPKRWVVERSFAWMGDFRRLSKDYEKTADASENMIMLAFIAMMLKTI